MSNMKHYETEVIYLWDTLVDRGYFTDTELDLVTSINGYSVDTLNDCLYARYGYRNLEQMEDEQMKEYRLIASKIERFNHADYVKARIYLEIEDLDASEDLIDAFVEQAYNWWSNDKYGLSPEDMGYAIHIGYLHIDDEFKTDFDAVMNLGLDGL